MNRNAVGWLFVAAQAVLLVALIVAAGADDWETPAWLSALGYVLIGLGLVLVGVAALGLGPALTATPVPTSDGALTTTGLYRLVRHPIYTGVLLAVIGVAVSAGSWVAIVIAGTTVVFFNLKARWEEARLAERYPGYPAYAAATPRFVPRRRAG